jgi:hypothetical protein
MGIRIGHPTKKAAMMAYADDVTIFMTHQQTFKLSRTCYSFRKCSFEHPKIQSQTCRLVGQIDEQADHPTLPGNNRIVLQIHQYSNTYRECHLFVDDREVQSPGERTFGSQTASKTMSTVCA